jgi:predicted solute-binding protein
MQHVELYVNKWTTSLGRTGADALDELANRARSIGLVEGSQMLRIIDG